MRQQVCVIGLGYIGLPTAALLADKGYYVHGVDVNKMAVDLIISGKVHIYEPSLDSLVKKVVSEGKLKAALTPEESNVFILAVPTPFKENNKPDLSFVEKATKSIIPFLKQGDTVILESTSPVGTTEKIAEWILEERNDLSIGKNKENQIYISHCPERVLPGHILKELIENDRIVGGINEQSTKKTVEFYKTFVTGKILETNARTAELSKLTENSFRDVNIAFANELSMICDHLNIDVWELIKLANHHPRVNILQPGPGVGGHCIAVDPWFIVDAAPDHAKLIHTARVVNDSKPINVLGKIQGAINSFVNPIICILGLSFKANIDDLRESPAVEIVKQLSDSYSGNILVSEPHIEKLPPKLNNFKNIKLADTYSAISESNIVVLLVDHDYFKQIDEDLLKNKYIIDTRGIFSDVKKVALLTS